MNGKMQRTNVTQMNESGSCQNDQEKKACVLIARGWRTLSGRWRADFEAPAAIGVSRVRRAPIEP
jgi:hypothetical protein